MKRTFFFCLLSLFVISGCASPANPSTPASVTFSPSPAQPTAIFTPLPPATTLPAPTPAFEQWLQSNQPDPDILKKTELSYTQVTGVAADKIQTQVITLEGPDGPFAILIDSATNAPLMIAVPGRKGTSSWQEANRKNLAEAAGFRMGTSTTESYTESWSPESKVVTTILGSEGNQLVIDYDLMWYNYQYPENSLRPDPDTFNFKILDAAIKFAGQHQLHLQGQNLMIGQPKFVPPWLKTLDKAALMDVLHTHISTVMKRYPQIDVWSVAAEFENKWDANFWVEKFGTQDLTWVKQAYEWAREANPNAKLYYSDFDIEFGGDKADRTFNLIKRLRDMETPIDAMAFQLHLEGKDFADEVARGQKMESLKGQIARYQALGIEVIAPEMDLSMHGIPGSETERQQLQAKIEKDILKTLLQSGVTNINFFGSNDKLNWKQLPENLGGPDANATIFDINGARKPSYYADEEAIVEFLQGK